MRTIIAAAALAVMLAGPARAEVIASCGPLAGYTYFYPDDRHKESGWQEAQVDAISVFTKSGDKLDLIMRGKAIAGEGSWTRSASDLGAVVLKIGGKAEEIMHILVAYGTVTEIYSLDLKGKTLALVAHKTGPFRLINAMVGRCE